jgi:spore coat protein U-like protein
MAAIAALASAPAFAGSQNGSMKVDLQVSDSCSLTVADVNFGNLTDFSTLPLTINTVNSIKCTPGANALVTVSNGGNVNGSQRRLKSGTNFIDYNVTDSTGTAWNTAGLNFTGTGADASLGMKVVLPVQTAKPAGAYTDTVSITVSY